MKTLLRGLLAGLGGSAVAIAATIIGFGAAATAGAFEHLYAVVTGWRGPASGPWPPTMDSELRFYAVLWGAYGLLLLEAAWRLEARRGCTPWLLLLFFLGGVGRVLSMLAVGVPHPFFVLLMGLELGLPPMLLLVWWAAFRGARTP